MSDLRNRIERRLEAYFPDHRTAAEIVDHVIALDSHWREFAFDWIIALAQIQPEIAYQFARRSAAAVQVLGPERCQGWLQTVLEVYDDQGLEAAIRHLENPDQFIVSQRKRSRGLLLAEARGVLELFLQGLSGRRLELQGSEEILTDSENLFLPETIDQYADREQNFACYRACVVHLWAQCRYGTWRLDAIEEIPRREPMQRTFHYLETLRLNACLERDYPGLARQMSALTPTPSIWQPMAQELGEPDSTVHDSIRLSHEHWDKPRPDRFLYQGVLDPDRVQSILETRVEREKQQFRLALARLGEEYNRPVDERLIAVDDETERLANSIRQDLGELPPDYLQPVSREVYYYEQQQQAQSAEDSGEDNGDEPEGIFVYDEWDYRRRAHRKRWCRLREREIVPDFDSDFVAETLRNYRGQIKTLRRSFEALREEYRILKKQPDGENLDLEALVDAIADRRNGMEMTSRIYRKAHRVSRDIAVIFMVDMSGSMKGWLNRLQREALILIAEALQALGDRYAIYGFSGNTRSRCELFPIKTFTQAYDLEVRARIAAITPQDFTRMGVTIRHLSHLLDGIDARTKLLITLSDGRPYDYDNYQDDYAIEDTRMALYEARQRGIHPFCITIDEQARDYLPHMYGDSSYVLINNIDTLPYRISEVYRHLTR